MNYIVALGNPGPKYENTRHNIGWHVVMNWQQAVGLPAFVASKQYSGRVSEGMVSSQSVIVLLPDTSMNASGSAVVKLVPPAAAAQLVVVYDDIALPLGEIKVSFGRGAGGHNGVSSIIQKLGTKDFVRVRVGIAPRSFWTGAVKRPAGHQLAAFVLGRFSRREGAAVETVSQKVAVILGAIISEGYVAAMNRYNT